MEEDYRRFLENKLIKTQTSGFQINNINQSLFPWQWAVTKWACRTGRAGLFEDCGLGKTAQQLVWADEVAHMSGRPTLILAPLAVSRQTCREGAKFDVPVNIAEMQADIKPGVNVTNYEKLEHFTPEAFGGLVLDESSILKAYMGHLKRLITDAFYDTPYKLACSATPAPNDLMELLNQAEFLGVMKSSEALSIWFVADQHESGKYRLKGHAREDFWRWVSEWAVCISKPSDIGFSDEGYELPPLTERDEIIPISELSDNWANGMFRDIETSATGFHAEKRRTLKARCARSAELANATNEQVVIWTYQNDEADELRRLLPEAAEVRGSDTASHKEQTALDFIDGKYRVLISKPSIFGYGLNFQNCRNVIFNGLDYSYESYYQAVRRFYRFGQQLPVNVWRVIGSTELNILHVIDAKQRLKDEMEHGMSAAMKVNQMESIRGKHYTLNIEPNRYTVPNWLREAI